MTPLEQYQQEQVQAYERTEYAEHAAAHLQVAMLAEIALQLRALNANLEKLQRQPRLSDLHREV